VTSTKDNIKRIPFGEISRSGGGDRGRITFILSPFGVLLEREELGGVGWGGGVFVWGGGGVFGGSPVYVFLPRGGGISYKENPWMFTVVKERFDVPRWAEDYFKGDRWGGGNTEGVRADWHVLKTLGSSK